MATATELPIDTTADANAMAAAIFGNGMNVTSATYSGAARASGIYSSGNTVSPGVTPGDTGVILSTGRATDFTNNSGTSNTNTSASTSTDNGGVNRDSDFDTLAGAPTYDAAFLEFEFTPEGDVMTIDFVISSEEYPEYVNSNFLDVVGVWVNGVQATVSVGNGQASVGNINGANRANLYNDNTADQYNTEMDGFTVTLSFSAPVRAGENNTLKIGVADVSDDQYDTNLLIAGGSVQSTIVAQDDQITMGNNDTKVLDVLANDSSTGGTLTITHINGQAVAAGDTITLASGQDVTLNGDGTLTILGDTDPETVYFNYTVEDVSGNTDTGLVEIEQVPCFVAGTRVDTARGPVAVERLRPGDLVLTADGQALPLRWVGTRRTQAEGAFAPVRIRAGTLGATRDVLVSPLHRVLVRDGWAALLFGEGEVLAKARDLVNGRTICTEPTGLPVTYVHLLFDGHQIVTTSGLASESYMPGPMTVRGFDADVQAEILALFPELESAHRPIWEAARPVLKRHEARALASRLAA